MEFAHTMPVKNAASQPLGGTGFSRSMVGAAVQADRPATDLVAHVHDGLDAPVGPGELLDAIAATQLCMHYQPIVRIADRRPIGIEALARIDHPTRGLLLPELFLPTAEAAGLHWTLTQATTATAFTDWGADRLRQTAADEALHLSLNIPLEVFLSRSALEVLDAARSGAGIAAHRITLELTEEHPLSGLAELGRAVAWLRRIGYGLAIDDVGPDIRDHTALLSLPFTMLKLDRALVRGAPRQGGNDRFVRTAVDSARAAGMTVVAEGVETATQWDYLRELGIDAAQGFLVGRAMPAAAVPAWLGAWQNQAAP
jgi:EAL domain-containing protein (putative c-di-GMP-specific phosphodiesterase class I)